MKLFYCLAFTYVGFVSCFRLEPEVIEHEDKFGLRTENVTAHVCPFLCILNGKYTCVPPPQCPLPPCVDATKKPLECCKYCPNGKTNKPRCQKVTCGLQLCKAQPNLGPELQCLLKVKEDLS